MSELPTDPIKRYNVLSTDEEKWIQFMSAQSYGSSSEHILSPDMLDFILLLMDELKLDKEAVVRAYIRYEGGDRIDPDKKEGV
jgi:hypothetical protein